MDASYRWAGGHGQWVCGEGFAVFSVTPDPAQATKTGIHVHEPLDVTLIWELARAGKLAGVTVINNRGLAEALADYCLVVFRIVASDHDDPVQSYQRYGLDPRVIIQAGNEANQAHDTDHWLQQMRDAEADGRRVVIFNDSVGWTEDDTWLERRPALEYARDHGHYIGLHAYGIVTDGGDIYHPLTEAGGWRWFGGRWIHLYSLMPDVQPNLILTECGAGGFQQNCGNAETWLDDVRHMENVAQVYPFLKSYNWWDYTRPGMGFDRDMINGYVHLLMGV